MHRLFLVSLCFFLGLSSLLPANEPAKKIQVLMVTGDDVAPYHDWREISECTRDVLVRSGKFDVRVCEDPAILESATALEKYDVIAFLLYAKSLPMLSEAGKENLLNFVEQGKGFYVQHLASASYGEWEDFGKLCGRHWVMGTSGHGPRGVFKCDIADASHPITKGLKEFKIFDELYAKLQGDEEIQVLVTADSDWSGATEPLVFVRNYGKGRSVQNALGHDHKAINNDTCKVLITRGVEWAATGKVSE
jgi:type 1 glutamine amidotransferase